MFCMCVPCCRQLLVILQWTFLLHRKLREQDVTIFHIQLCIALFCMLIIFVCGIDKTSVYGGCVLVSVLIHYFTLVAVMFMGAEAVLLFQKLIIVFGQTTAKFFIAVSLICWCECILVYHLHIILALGIWLCLTTNSLSSSSSCSGTNHSSGDPNGCRPFRRSQQGSSCT